MVNNLKGLLLLIIVLSVGCEQGEMIVFSSSRSGNSDIWMMNDNGIILKQLTSSSYQEWGPTIKSETEISFLRELDNGFQRVILNLKSGKETYIGQPEHCILNDKNAVFSGDGMKFLYECDGNIFMSDTMTGFPTNLTVELKGESTRPTWFPDDTKIAFTYIDQDAEIYTYDLNSNEFENITNSPFNEEAPDISPNGTEMVFTSNEDGNRNQEIYLFDLVSKTKVNISNSPDWELIARWSRDGGKIYFGSNRDGNWEIYKYTISNQEVIRLTNNEEFDGDPRVL